MSTPAPAPANPPLVTLFGGKHIPVTYRAAEGQKPATESVFVREVKPSEMGKYFATVTNMTQFAEFVAGKDAGWADTLTNASLLAVVDAAKEINDPFFVEWVKRQGPEIRRMAEATVPPEVMRALAMVAA